MTKIKAIFFDIDGTIRSFKTKTIPENTKATLLKLKEQGIKIFIATGRAPYNITFLDELLDFKFDGYITINGQYCYNDKGEVLHRAFINKDDILSAIPYFENNNIACDFTTIDKTYLNLHNDKVKRLEEELGATQYFTVAKDLRSVFEEDIYQLNVFVDEVEEKEVLKYMPNSKSARWIDYFMDVIPKDGGKDKGIDAIIKNYGIKLEETMAFGDGGNDIDMLKYVGIGVAMGNARDDVKGSADYITASVDDDGITKALKHFGVLD